MKEQKFDKVMIGYAQKFGDIDGLFELARKKSKGKLILALVRLTGEQITVTRVYHNEKHLV